MDYKALYEQSQKENERLERLRITFINRYGELKKIVCPDSQFQDHKSIREGCLKLQKENEELKEEIEKQVCLDDLFWNVSESLKEHIDDYPTHKEGEIYDAIEQLKDELEELKKMNQKNYHEKEKLKAFINELKINVVKKD